MPTYEYECQKCGHRFTVVQSISARKLTTCPKSLCSEKKWGRGKVKRLVGSGAGLLFKGSGFYITDYRSESYKQAAKKETETSKPAAKPDSPPTKTEPPPASDRKTGHAKASKVHKKT